MKQPHSTLNEMHRIETKQPKNKKATGYLGNTAKPRSTEQQLVTPLDSTMDAPIAQQVTEQHSSSEVLQLFTLTHTKGLRGRM